MKPLFDETLEDNKLDLLFKITETEKFFIEKINIFGNNITKENVIRNYLEIDEVTLIIKYYNLKV